MKKINLIRVSIECITYERKAISASLSPTLLRYFCESPTFFWFTITPTKQKDFLRKLEISQLLDQTDPVFLDDEPVVLNKLKEFIICPQHTNRRITVRTGIKSYDSLLKSIN